MALNIWVLLACLGLINPVFSQSVDGSKHNDPTTGLPSSYFAAATTVPVAALQSAAAKANIAAKDATYPINANSGAKRVTIHKDWTSFSEGAAFVWVADMDVDCDGIDYKCKGNPDGQSETNFGALAAYEVPFIVIPDTFGTTYKSDLSGNNVAAVICDNKMFYGIYGDSNSDDPEVIGEASWLMARTCFPGDNLNGNSGHGNADVTYIIFTGNDAVFPSSSLNKNYMTNFSTLRCMGDNLVTALVRNLDLGSGGSNSTSTTTSAGPGPTGSCSWSGHCAGNSCSSADDCSGDLVCTNGKCASGESNSSSSWIAQCRASVASKVLLQGLILYIARGNLLF